MSTAPLPAHPHLSTGESSPHSSSEPIHVIVISSVRPEPTSAGQIILYRHLVDQPGITVEVHGSEPQAPTVSKLIRRVLGRLGRTRLRRWIEDCWVLWGGRWIDPELPRTVARPERTVVLTVAHGDGFMAAQRFARRHRLPLVSIFHDWWPDIPNLHQPARRLLERRFRELAHTSEIAFCVCDGMKEELGSDNHAIILPPLSAETPLIPKIADDRPSPFKLLYFGNLNDYGPMLGDALEESLKHPEILLQVRGANPAWSDERKATMRANGRWLEFAPRDELDAWLASADAFLIPMVFDPALRRRMETSFPSKLIEFAQFGKPLVVWGPEHCSAVEWARGSADGEKALCITSADPSKLLAELASLNRNPARSAELQQQAEISAANEFSATTIKATFTNELRNLVRLLRDPSSTTAAHE